jgi:hypothetical protein
MAIIHKEISLKSFYILASCFEECVETFLRIKEDWWLFKIQKREYSTDYLFLEKQISKWQRFAKKKKKKKNLCL